MYNGHGDVTALLSETGAIVGTYYYDVWGNILEKNESEQISNPYRYAGYQYDDETGLYYLNARYYDAKIARFLTEDTVTGDRNDPLSLNRYSYCYNNPIVYDDPTGNVASNLYEADGNVRVNTQTGSAKNSSVTGKNDKNNLITADSTKNKNEAAKEKAAKEQAARDKAAKELSAKYNAAKAQAQKEKNTDKVDLKSSTVKAAKEIGGGFVKGFDITLKVLAAPGNVARSICYDIDKGNFDNIVDNTLKSVTGERQVSTLDLIISKKTQADLFEKSEIAYYFVNYAAGTFDPMLLAPAGKVGSMLDDVALGAKNIGVKVESTIANGTGNTGFHAVGNAKQAQSVLDGINPKYFNPDSRFGGAFYIGDDGATIVAELAEHGNVAEYAIRYDVNFTGQNVLDLTDVNVARTWGFESGVTSTEACQQIGNIAQSNGYSSIIFQSYRGTGTNYAIFDNFNEILNPMMVTPIK